MAKSTSGGAAGASPGAALGLSAGMGLIQTNLEYMSELSRYKSMVKYHERLGEARNRQIEQNAETASADYRRSLIQDYLAFETQKKELARQDQQTQTRALQAKALAATMAGESGVSGLSVEDTLADYERQRAQAQRASQQTLEDSGSMYDSRARSLYDQTKARIASIQPYEAPEIEAPNLAMKVVSGLLNVGGQNAGGIAQMMG